MLSNCGLHPSIQLSTFSFPLCSELHGKKMQAITLYVGFQLSKTAWKACTEYFKHSLHVTRVSTTPSLLWKLLSSSLSHSLLVLIIVFFCIFSQLSHSIAIFAFSSSPSHLTSCSTLPLPLLPSVFTMLLLMWMKNPNQIGRVLPNRQEELIKNNWIYGQLHSESAACQQVAEKQSLHCMAE